MVTRHLFSLPYLAHETFAAVARETFRNILGVVHSKVFLDVAVGGSASRVVVITSAE
jgi:hypothetical protein